MNYTDGYNLIIKTAGIMESLGLEQPDKPGVGDYAGAAAQVGIAGALAPGAYSRLTNQQRLYHGTASDDAHKSILREGLRPEYGGTGASFIDGNFVENSKNKIHVTPQSVIANTFSVMNEDELNALAGTDLDGVEARLARGKAKELLFGHPRTVTIDMPYTQFADRFSHDPDFLMGQDTPSGWEASKHTVAATSEFPVDPKYIRGGVGNKEHSVLRESLGDMGTYLRKHPGRFAGGALSAMLAGGLAVDAANTVREGM
jgi:hypothetical protein